MEHVMNEHEHKEAHGEDHGDLFKIYLMVFGSLAVLTGISFGTYELLKGTPGLSLVIIMIVSVIKATLVAVIFMHLKWDWGRVFGIMIPVVVMAIMMIIVLWPDMVSAPRRQVQMRDSALVGEER
jgi:caa(3)-type oxidase subunit IV